MPDVGEIRRVYAGNRATEVINMWCDSLVKLETYRQKSRWGIFHPKFLGSSSSKTNGPIEKIKGDAKLYGHPLSLRKVWWRRSATARRRENR